MQLLQYMCPEPEFSSVRADANNSGMKRKCADAIGTVLVPWAGHFEC